MLAAAASIFFVSGFAALLYQVIWQRLLAIFSGADVHSATIVVAAYMSGLGFGSLWGGALADRVSHRRCLAWFAGAELGIAVFGFSSSTLFYDVLYVRIGQWPIGPVATAAVLFAALLWPTFLMGMSLPLLTRGLTYRLGAAAGTAGWLYAINTLGAAVGALIGTWGIVPAVGLGGGLKGAAALNLLAAAAVMPLFLVSRRGAADEGAAVPGRTAEHAAGAVRSRRPYRHWVMLAALSGFLGLSLEIIWFRLLGVMLKSTAFTFGTLLGLYLLGLGAGATAASLVIGRIRRPAVGFATLQAGAVVYAAVSLAVLVAAVGQWPPLAWFASYLGQYESLDLAAALAGGHASMAGGDAGIPSRWHFARLYLVVPAIMIGPPTFMAGLAFPLLQRVVQTDLDQVGRRVGTLLAANILGSTLGAVVTGLGLLAWAGTAGTLNLLLVVSVIFALVAAQERGWFDRLSMRVGVGAAAVAMIVAISAAMPGRHGLWATLHGASPFTAIVGEDGSGVSLIRPDPRRSLVFVNGIGQSWMPYGDIHTVLGALPAFLHPAPRTAALIGLGSGDTLFAMAGRRDLEHITSIEIVRPQLATLREAERRQVYPGLTRWLQDPRIEHVFGDGRLHVRRAGRTYDIIEADALRPTSAYSGNLYSDAYFTLLRDHLAPGGLAVSWAPTPRVWRTFLKTFPHVWQHGAILIGGNAPIPLDFARVAQQLRDPRVRDYYAGAAIDIEQLLAPYLGGGQMFTPGHDRSSLVDINTDLFPRDEFELSPIGR